MYGLPQDSAESERVKEAWTPGLPPVPDWSARLSVRPFPILEHPVCMDWRWRRNAHENPEIDQLWRPSVVAFYMVYRGEERFWIVEVDRV